MSQGFNVEDELVKIKGYLSDDKLKLFIDVHRVKEGEITEALLLKLVTQHISEERVDRGVLKSISEKLKEESPVEKRKIAQGTPPQKGLDGKVLYLVKRIGVDTMVMEQEALFLDPREMHLFDNVSTGEKVARIYPPKEGIPGEDAFGNAIEAEAGTEVAIQFDSTIKQNDPEEGNAYSTLESLVDGYLSDEQGKLTMNEELQIRGELDYSFGSIDFIGRVTIQGDVLPGFRVKAQKGIHISGNVNMAELVCHEGDIVVNGYFLGGHKGRILCSKDVKLKGLSQGVVEVQGVLTVDTEIRESKIRSESYVSIPNGRILSGKLYSVCGIEAKEVGSEEGVRTEITLCNTVEAGQEYQELLIKIENHEKAIVVITSHLGPYAKNPSRLILLSQPLRAKLEKLQQKRESIEASLAVLKKRQESLLSSARVNETARVSATGKIFEGVVVYGGENLHEVTKTLDGPITIEYLHEEGTLATKEFLPIECSFREKENESGKETQST